MPSEFQSNEPPHVLGIPVDVTPPPLRNSEMPPVVWVWIFSRRMVKSRLANMLRPFLKFLSWRLGDG